MFAASTSNQPLNVLGVSNSRSKLLANNKHVAHATNPTSIGFHYAQTISRATNFQNPNQYQHYAMTMQPTRHSATIARVPQHHPSHRNIFLAPYPAPQTQYTSHYYAPQEVANNFNKTPQDKVMLHQLRPEAPGIVSLMQSQQALLNRPLCRCRVMYLGSSVPHITKNGLHGIQEPLRLLYPEEQFSGSKSLQQDPGTIDISHLSASLGIDSWLSVWSNGLLLENVDEFGREIKRFFSIESLHYCAAVRFFDTATLESNKEQIVDDDKQQDPNNNIEQATVQDKLADERKRKGVVRFLPLDAPLFQCPGMIDPKHPPVFASIMRRTTGVKVLECHAFICRRDAASNALVRCCTQAYADLLNAKRLSAELGHQQHSASSHRRATSLAPPRKSSYNSNEDEEEGRSSRATSSTENNNELLKSSIITTENVSSTEDNYAIISKLATSSKRHEKGSSKTRPPKKDIGSSRSLYDDFMPKSNECCGPTCCSGAGEQNRQHLSHSLDLMQMEQGENSCCPSGEDICYSVSKNKRHSRSMQELDGPFEFTVPGEATRRSSRSSRRREYSRSKSQGGRSHDSSHQSRKAQSYQDMRSQRKGSMSSFLQKPVNPPTDNGLHKDDQQIEQLSTADVHYERVAPPSNGPSHKKTSRKNSRRAHRGDSLRRTSNVAPPTSSRWPTNEQPAQNYYIPPSTISQGPPSAHYQQPNMLYHTPMLNHYMMYGYGPGHPTLYGPPHQPPPPAPAFYPPPTGHYMPPYQNHYVPGQYALPAMQYQSQTISARRGRDRTSKSQTLATRFRCLSPPLNLLSRSSKVNGQQKEPQQQLQQFENRNSNNAPENSSSKDGSIMSDVNVVSGQPAFSNSTTINRRKMSWIKRLSLNMGYDSDSGCRVASSDPSGNQTQPHQNEHDQQPKQQTTTVRKRRSLFLGSLTLGRTKRDSRLAAVAS